MKDRKKIFKHGVMQALMMSEMYRGNFGSVLYCYCARYNKQIIKAYPTLDATDPVFIVEVRDEEGGKSKYKYEYYKFKKAAEIIKQFALMMQGKGLSYNESKKSFYEWGIESIG